MSRASAIRWREVKRWRCPHAVLPVRPLHGGHPCPARSSADRFPRSAVLAADSSTLRVCIPSGASGPFFFVSFESSADDGYDPICGAGRHVL